MCRSMVEIQSVAVEIRRGKKEEEDRRKLQGKNIMAPLLHRAAIKMSIPTQKLIQKKYLNVKLNIVVVLVTTTIILISRPRDITAA